MDYMGSDQNQSMQGNGDELIELPKVRRRPKLLSILGGVAAVLLVAGVATASYFVSNRISGRTAVAPTAPESEPLAACTCTSWSGCNGRIEGPCPGDSSRASCCPLTPTPTRVPTPPTSTPSPTPRPPTPTSSPTLTPTVAQACTSGACRGCVPGRDLCCYSTGKTTGPFDRTCLSSCTCPSSNPTTTPTLTPTPPSATCTSLGGQCHYSQCPVNWTPISGTSGTQHCSNSLQQCCKQSTPSTPVAGGYCTGTATECGSCRSSGSTPSCVKDCGKCNGVAASWWKECSDSSCTGSGSSSSSSGGGSCPSIPNQGSTGPVGSSCDSSNCGGSCNQGGVNYGYKCGTLCYKDSCGASACGSSSGPTCDSSKRDAPNSNSIKFTKAGKVILFTRSGFPSSTVTLSGPKTITIPFGSGNAVQQTTTFQVNANETYTIKVRVSGESKDGYGWRPNKSQNVCGPTNSICGADADITPVRNLAAANSDVSGITAGGAANIQCWGDAERGDTAQDYDYNDFTLIFGYEKQTQSTVPNCKDISGPSTLTVGEKGSYTATFVQSQSGGLTDGEIFYSTIVNEVDQKNILQTTPPSKKGVANNGTVTGDFTPTTPGKYWLRCRAWNDGISECRPPATVDAAPRFPCAGPGYEMLVTVNVPAGPKCVMAKIYTQSGSAWVESTNPSSISSGTKVRIGAKADLSSAKKARFKINGGEWIISESKMTVGTDSLFYYEFTVRPGSYTIESEIQ